MKSCIQKALYNLQKALCQSRAFTQRGQVLCGQPHPQHGSGRKLLNSIINSPLIQLRFFLFHFRITISCYPRKSPNRFLMISRRDSCVRTCLMDPNTHLIVARDELIWLTHQTSLLHENSPFPPAS